MNGESAISFKNKDNKEVLVVSKKAFLHMDQTKVFIKDNGNWVCILFYIFQYQAILLSPSKVPLPYEAWDDFR